MVGHYMRTGLLTIDGQSALPARALVTVGDAAATSAKGNHFFRPAQIIGAREAPPRSKPSQRRSTAP
jgi:hypothetical protein